MERLNLEVDLKVSNPNYVALEFQRVNYQLTIDGANVLTGTLTEAFKVPAKGEYLVSFPLTVKLENLTKGKLDLMMNRRLRYQLSAKLDSSVPIQEKTTFTVKKVDELSF